MKTMQKKHSPYHRSLLVTLTCLSLSLLFCAGGAVAWLSKNRKTAGDGMTVQASVGTNLVISNSIAGIKAANILGGENDPFTATLSVDSGSANTTYYLTAATHATESDYTEKLKTLKNTNDLDRKTGKIAADSDAGETYMHVTKGVHYLDYVAYIAAAGATLTDQTLTMEISIDKNAITGSSETYKGLSVDVWYRMYNSVNDAQYKDTINAAGHDAEGRVKSSVTIYDAVDIPNNVNGYIEITLRVYFDGALQIPQGQTGAGNTYVRAADLYVDKIPLTVIFRTTNAATD